MKKVQAAIAITGVLMAAGQAHAVTLDFRYDYDSGGFFSDTSARDALEYAGDLIASQLNDSLAAMSPGSPGSGRTWTARFLNPSDRTTEVTLDNLVVPTDTLVIYAGATSLGGSLGVGGPGGFSYSYIPGVTDDWAETVLARGQSGALSDPTTDFGPWGGAISFDTGTNWFFGTDTTAGLDAENDLYDFVSVALHELGHLLGIGTADSWDTYVAGPAGNNTFIGSHAASVHGSAVPLDTLAAHWAPDTEGSLNGEAREANFTPFLQNNQRKFYTDLDWAALADIGWEVNPAVIPEPSSLLMLAGLTVGLACRRRRAS